MRQFRINKKGKKGKRAYPKVSEDLKQFKVVDRKYTTKSAKSW